MIGAAGDRRDDDIRELGAIAADHFDVIVVREDERLRGRGSRRVRGGVGPGWLGDSCRVEIVREELAAVRHCMARANPGDLVSCRSMRRSGETSPAGRCTGWSQETRTCTARCTMRWVRRQRVVRLAGGRRARASVES